MKSNRFPSARIKPLLLALSIACALPTASASEQPPQLGKAPVAEVIAAMSLQEKVALLTGQGMHIPGVDLGDGMRAPVVGQSNDSVPGAAGTSFPIERLGIPSIVFADGPAGLRISPKREGEKRSYYATAFPIGTLLASSWDTALVERVGRAMGQEVKSYGVDVLLAPALNLHRYPLGGRNFEYYAEDPLLSGQMAAAIVRGVQSHQVGTSVKHFAANNHEWNRNTIDVKVSDRALHELYLKGFEITVKQSEPWTVMSSYNRINGSFTSEDPWLLTDVLRDRWGFDGLVMTDWFGGTDPVKQMVAGNDLLMPGTQMQQNALLAAVRDGKLDEKILDRNVARVLDLVMRTPTFRGQKPDNAPDLKTHAHIAREAAAEGMVLLKNAVLKNEQSALPLKTHADASGSKKRIALFGNSAYRMVTGGTGSGDVAEAYTISLPQGLEAAGFSTDGWLKRAYGQHIAAAEKARGETDPFMLPPPLPELLPGTADIEAYASNNDVALVTIGRNSGEFADRKADDDFYLTQTEHQLLERVSSAFRKQGKPVIAVLNIGGVIETASWQDQVDALLLAWQPGQEAGHAIADVLTGAINPSGKLTDTFALKLDDYPASQNFPGVTLEGPDPATEGAKIRMDRKAEVDYRDDIWVGYRHFNRKDSPVAFPFGHGLSYTNFRYGWMQLRADDAGLTASVTITNTGKVPGKEVAQLYVSAPKNEKLPKPAAELRAFGKTRLLQPGQSQTMVFRLTPADLASFDPAADEWVTDAGEYTVSIGTSSRDIRAQARFDRPNALRFKP